MTWFVSTSDIIGAIVFVPLLTFVAAVFTSIFVFERLKIRGNALAMWSVFGVVICAYSAAVGYVVWEVLT